MRVYDLTTVQVLLLNYLNENKNKEIIQRDICERLSLKHSTIIKILKRLESKGLIVKKTKYRSIINITDKGKKLIESLEIKNGFIENKLLDGFSNKELELLSIFLDRISKNIEEKF